MNEALSSKARHDRAGFSCGLPALDNYLQRQASQDVERRAAVVYVAKFAAPKIAGYYTQSQFTVELAGLPENVTKRLPRYSLVPATPLGRLAVSSEFQGRGLGRDLLFDALWRSLPQSEHIASAGVVVDAKDKAAVGFYRKYGFLSLIGVEQRLFLPVRTVEGIL